MECGVQGVNNRRAGKDARGKKLLITAAFARPHQTIRQRRAGKETICTLEKVSSNDLVNAR
jgi:hypothetical protein